MRWVLFFRRSEGNILCTRVNLTFIVSQYLLACTKPYYFDVADDSRVCYVEKDFSSKVICKKPHDEVQCLHYDVLGLRLGDISMFCIN